MRLDLDISHVMMYVITYAITGLRHKGEFHD
jgi:hypothetical protein